MNRAPRHPRVSAARIAMRGFVSQPRLQSEFARCTSRVLQATARGLKTLVYNIRHDYFYFTFLPIERELRVQEPGLQVYYAYAHDRPALVEQLRKWVPPERLIDNRISPLIPFHAFVSPETNWPDFPIWTHTRRIQIYHGTGVWCLRRYLEILGRYDAHFIPGPQFASFAREAMQLQRRAANVHAVGYPKTDSLRMHDPLTDELRTELGLQSAKVVVYAPSWGLKGSLQRFQDAIIDALAATGARVLLKVHNYLFEAHRYNSEYPMNWRERLAALQTRVPNLTIVDRPNTQDLYPLANVIVSDGISSTTVEACIARKPLVVFEFRPEDGYGEDCQVETAAMQVGFRFRTPEEARQHVEAILAADEGMQQRIAVQQKEQDELTARYLFNVGNATAAAVSALRFELGLSSTDATIEKKGLS